MGGGGRRKRKKGQSSQESRTLWGGKENSFGVFVPYLNPSAGGLRRWRDQGVFKGGGEGGGTRKKGGRGREARQGHAFHFRHSIGAVKRASRNSRRNLGIGERSASCLAKERGDVLPVAVVAGVREKAGWKRRGGGGAGEGSEGKKKLQRRNVSSLRAEFSGGM